MLALNPLRYPVLRAPREQLAGIWGARISAFYDRACGLSWGWPEAFDRMTFGSQYIVNEQQDGIRIKICMQLFNCTEPRAGKYMSPNAWTHVRSDQRAVSTLTGQPWTRAYPPGTLTHGSCIAWGARLALTAEISSRICIRKSITRTLCAWDYDNSDCMYTHMHIHMHMRNVHTHKNIESVEIASTFTQCGKHHTQPPQAHPGKKHSVWSSSFFASAFAVAAGMKVSFHSPTQKGNH